MPCLLCGCDQVTPERLIHMAPSLGSPHPQLTSRRVLCNIEVRSWLRYLSSKISIFLLLKVDFWPWQLMALQIHIMYTFLVCNTTECGFYCNACSHIIVMAVCALIKTIYMNCFSSERSRSANVGLMLDQCNRRQDNTKYTLWSAWRFL